MQVDLGRSCSKPRNPESTTTTAAAPASTTDAPGTTTNTPVTTLPAPATTMAVPGTTTAAPSSTTLAPCTTTSTPASTPAAPPITTTAPNTTTKSPGTKTRIVMQMEEPEGGRVKMSGHGARAFSNLRGMVPTSWAAGKKKRSSLLSLKQLSRLKRPSPLTISPIAQSQKRMKHQANLSSSLRIDEEGVKRLERIRHSLSEAVKKAYIAARNRKPWEQWVENFVSFVPGQTKAERSWNYSLRRFWE
ncbi:hypothetical protein H257_18908 [Aphanomyces astaci]|uniref:Uncharacterized protein n=1 Tax=Aphanomyces astaci TaxID=112090 RepID=W4FB70_APHAT|nr:hypothetical protein H257_18908 [Aphanomyces astaci]ETV64159.1 hypothetical protein H257_18908 [Aphanomyces astaci]|eukprot:XP_009846358.1 hypothetical protein H257_18908 [Aphanomyces astaci]